MTIAIASSDSLWNGEFLNNDNYTAGFRRCCKCCCSSSSVLADKQHLHQQVSGARRGRRRRMTNTIRLHSDPYVNGTMYNFHHLSAGGVQNYQNSFGEEGEAGELHRVALVSSDL